MKEPVVTERLAREHGLSAEEFEKIKSILGRTPTYTELGIFSVMWSEHCGYKNSILLIKTLPRAGESLLAEPGKENAGVVDFSDEYAIVFKIESHNHPSAVEPFQGAATGVGGILRDIFAMGARPIACLDSLRFGPLSDEHTRYLFRGVVEGIGFYGNCFGVPTVGGEVYFDEAYGDNPLVNAMAVGLVRKDKLASSVAAGVGNLALYVGAATGRDGIHGATFASEELSEESEKRRPSVQIGDPFMEKLLVEATLEMIEKGLVVSVQDMGAAGLTSSSVEMAAKGELGMELELSLVPQREEGMTPYEIMLSESQERMLFVVEEEKFDEVKEILERWDLHYAVVGRVTDDGKLTVRVNGEIYAAIPVNALVVGGGCPAYKREPVYPKYIDRINDFTPDDFLPTISAEEALVRLISSPNIASKRWVFRQYDHQIMSNTVVLPGGDAAVLRIKETGKGIAVSTDCNGRYSYLDPYTGAAIAVAESARNVVVTGAKPVAITNCLNFGDPYKPDVYYQFSESIRGMADACRALGTPVTGGNVSFYNESATGTVVYPTPVIGMLGILDDIASFLTASFKQEGDVILLLGETLPEIGGSEYLKEIYRAVWGPPPSLDLAKEKAVQDAFLEIATCHLATAAHDVSDGGLAVALVEMGILARENPLGFVLNNSLLDNLSDRERHLFLFSESQSRIVMTCEEEHLPEVKEILSRYDVKSLLLGKVCGDKFDFGRFSIPVSEALDLYYNSIEKILKGEEK